MEISFDYNHEPVTYWRADRISMKRSHVADPIPRATKRGTKCARASTTPETCSVIGTLATRLCVREQHKHTHQTVEKPFLCDAPGCTYACSQAGHLVAHARTHALARAQAPGEKPFKCDAPGCTYACLKSGNLVTHKRTHALARAQGVVPRSE